MIRGSIFLFLALLTFKSQAQDTLFLKSGEIKVVQINKIDNTNELLFYTFGSKLYVRDLNSIDRYTRSEQGENNLIQSNTTLIEGSFMDAQRIERSEKDLFSNYEYSKFSAGLNLLSPLSALELSTMAYNLNISFYGQYDFDEIRGIRLPVRVGFNIIKGESTRFPYSREQYKHRDLHYEFGIEYIENTAENIMKKHGYHLVGGYLGAVTNIWSVYSSYPEPTIYKPSSPRGYFRIAYNYGIQFNFSRSYQLNIELGCNLNNMKRDRLTLGLQGAVNLVHRFSGKEIKK